MDTLESVHHKRATKHTKTKKKPVRVVYISNPMRVKTSASEFMALVQELTGQDAELPDPTKFSAAAAAAAAANDVGGNQMMVADDIDEDDEEDHAIVEVPIVVDHGSSSSSSLAPASIPPHHLNFEPFDHEVFTPQMLENFTGLLPSSLFYEPLHG